MFQKISDSEHFLRIKEGAAITSFRRHIFFYLPKNFAGEPLLCFRKFRLTKNVVPKREKLRFPVESLLSHSAEKLRRGTL